MAKAAASVGAAVAVSIPTTMIVNVRIMEVTLMFLLEIAISQFNGG
jgi:hypothetical protein